uniref:Molybdopterin synthase sulfur carrier subunit n=1 Tax=Candidatus Kentrum eta TaxID=2126337 RepID=A0A450V6E7_9GAMM|nr:MAG: molybdopterin synthase sulfur carrier subunit [Candidatus Kentron sp. H]VFK00349.1 MAG: molybdopterin synthase sulfur carrier subunit [Candidatus Kentron sp. H]VFK04514.1 MAG: molybdopterin synthase sulfur carrier subunit [Candidatus Kentron sp. H]
MSEPIVSYRVKLFAALKEHVDGEDWVFEGRSGLTGRALLNAFFDGYPELDGLRGVTRIAVNQVFCQGDASLTPEDELALIPPVSGG